MYIHTTPHLFCQTANCKSAKLWIMFMFASTPFYGGSRDNSHCTVLIKVNMLFSFIPAISHPSLLLRATDALSPHTFHYNITAHLEKELRLFPLTLTKTISLSDLNEDCGAFWIIFFPHSLSRLGLRDIDERQANCIRGIKVLTSTATKMHRG